MIAQECFSTSEIGPLHRIHGIKDPHVYRSDGRRHSEDNMPLRWWLQQGNDPKHTVKTVGRWFWEKQVPLLSWPSLSLALNPNENLWNMLVDAAKEAAAPVTLDDLKEVLCHAWDSIPRSTRRA